MSDDRNKHGVYMPAAESESKRRNYAKSTPTANVVRAVGTRTVAGVFGDLRQGRVGQDCGVGQTMTPYTGPLAAPIRSTITAFAKQRGLPCTVAMTYTPGAVPMVIDVDWVEIGRGFTVEESESIHEMTDAEIEKQVAEDVGRMLHPPKVKRFKKKRRR